MRLHTSFYWVPLCVHKDFVHDFCLWLDRTGTHAMLISGLKVNDQLVAYATRFLAVRLKNHVPSHHRALKAKVQCDFSSAYSPDHSNVLRLINIINISHTIFRCVFYSSSLSLNSHWIPRTRTLFFSTFCNVNNSADSYTWTNEARAPCAIDDRLKNFSSKLKRICQEHVFSFPF